MLKFTLLTFLLFIAGLNYAQDPCSSGRYADAVFSQFTLTSNLTYGQNSNWANSNTVLKLDLYEPTNDTLAARPLIIWVHGGSFIGGSKRILMSKNFRRILQRKAMYVPVSTTD